MTVIAEIGLPLGVEPIAAVMNEANGCYKIDLDLTDLHNLCSTDYFRTNKVMFRKAYVNSLEYCLVCDAYGSERKWDGFAGVWLDDVNKPVYGPVAVVGLDEEGRPCALDEFKTDALWRTARFRVYSALGKDAGFCSWMFHMTDWPAKSEKTI